MKRKVSTIMEESLFRRAKSAAAAEGRPLSAVIEDAITAYLAPNRAIGKAESRVEASWGAFAVPLEVVQAVMEDEDDWLDS